MPVTRRRSSRDTEPEEERDQRPTRSRRRASDDMPDEERNTPPRRSRRSRDTEPEEAPRRRRGRGSEDEGGRGRRRSSGGFASYTAKKRSSASFADDFRPGENKKILIKVLDAEPFATYNQHWISDMPQGERKSYVCYDDEDLHDDSDRGCPLCEIGEKAKTLALFNVLDLSNPRKPENKVWSASPAVVDVLARAAEDKKTSPINREDLYWEVELQKKGKRYSWNIVPIKARDLEEDFDMEPLDEDEIEEFSQDMHDDVEAVTKIDSWDDLDSLAEDLMK